jgi:MFS transporter, ACS family, tartrate transporter
MIHPVSVNQVSTSDEAVGRSALRKASLHLLPLIALGYGAAYMDRINISFAALRMNRDLHFSASTYGFGAGIFFLSYAACEIPSNLLLLRFGRAVGSPGSCLPGASSPWP